MSEFDQNNGKAKQSRARTSKATELRPVARFDERGKTIYNTNSPHYEWNDARIKNTKLHSQRIQTDAFSAINHALLGDTMSLITLQEEDVLATGYNPYDSGLSAMKQSRKPRELNDLTPREKTNFNRKVDK